MLYIRQIETKTLKGGEKSGWLETSGSKEQLNAESLSFFFFYLGLIAQNIEKVVTYTHTSKHQLGSLDLHLCTGVVGIPTPPTKEDVSEGQVGSQSF